MLDETHLSGIVANWGARVFYALCGLVVALCGGFFWMGYVVAEMQGEVHGMRSDVSEITTVVRGQFELRLRAVEIAIAPGVLSDAKQEISSLKKRVRELEARGQ